MASLSIQMVHLGLKFSFTTDGHICPPDGHRVWLSPEPRFGLCPCKESKFLLRTSPPPSDPKSQSQDIPGTTSISPHLQFFICTAPCPQLGQGTWNIWGHIHLPAHGFWFPYSPGREFSLSGLSLILSSPEPPETF